MEKLQAEADRLGKSSFAFAFYMDRQKDERARGITIACTTKEFYTDKYHYTIIDAPGHRDFIKNMISGASQADVALIMVPADGNFVTSIQKGSHKEGQVQGQTRQHARLINLLGVKQVIVGINKMDSDVAKYSQERYNEVVNEMKLTLQRVGFKKEQIEKEIPFLPISGFQGDNLLKKSEKMPWWNGVDIKGKNITTLLDALNEFAQPPTRNETGLLRIPVSGVHNIKGVGDVITGRVEQGVLKPNDEIKFVPTDTASNACAGKCFSIEMHHKKYDRAGPGDNVGINVKGLQKGNMPQNGDVIVLKKDTTLGKAKSFTAVCQMLEHPNGIKVGYTPIGFVRTGRSAIRLKAINWKMGKDTGGQKVENPTEIKTGDAAEVVFEPAQPFVVDKFSNCEGLGRLAVMEGNGVVMLGKVTDVKF